MQTKLVIWVHHFPTFNNNKITSPAKCLIKKIQKSKLILFGKKKNMAIYERDLGTGRTETQRKQIVKKQRIMKLLGSALYKSQCKMSPQNTSMCHRRNEKCNNSKRLSLDLQRRQLESHRRPEVVPPLPVGSQPEVRYTIFSSSAIP